MKKLIALLFLSSAAYAQNVTVINTPSNPVNVSGSISVSASTHVYVDNMSGVSGSTHTYVDNTVPVTLSGNNTIWVTNAVNVLPQIMGGDLSTRPVGFYLGYASVPVSIQNLNLPVQISTGGITAFVPNFPTTQSVNESGTFAVTAGTGSFTMGFVGATGSTVTPSYQGVISSVPVAIQGLPTVQVISSTMQVQGITQIVTSTLQVQGITQVVTSTLQVQGIAQVVTSTLQVSGSMEVLTSTLQVSGSVVVTSTLQVQLGTLPTLTKGTQGATGFTVQELKDAGRSNITFNVSNSTVGATTVESALTFKKSAGTGATSSAYTFVITSGKKFRITHISIATQASATATTHSTTFSLRLNAAGNCNAGSTPVIGGPWRSASAAVAGQWDRYSIPLGEGYEIAGDGTLQICASVNSTFVTNAPTADMTIIGYEY